MFRWSGVSFVTSSAATFYIGFAWYTAELVGEQVESGAVSRTDSHSLCGYPRYG